MLTFNCQVLWLERVDKSCFGASLLCTVTSTLGDAEDKREERGNPKPETHVLPVLREVAMAHRDARGLVANEEECKWAVVVTGERNIAGIAFNGPLGD